jgi:hypothetical protein
MKPQFRVRMRLRFLLSALLPFLVLKLSGQQEEVTAFKQTLAEDQQRLRQYQWLETTIVNIKGEEKSRTRKLCFYRPDGSVQKHQVSAPAPDEQQPGVRGRVKERKKEEITEDVQKAVALVHQYVPPDLQRIQASQAAGNVSLTATGSGTFRLDLRNYLKPGDVLSLNIESGSNSLQRTSVQSYLDSQKDAITMDATFAFLPSGANYPSDIVLNAPEKKLQVIVQNSNYETNPVAAPPPQPPRTFSVRPPETPQSDAHHPTVDQIADKVIQKYQQASCEQLWNLPKSAEEPEAIKILQGDASLRTEFINKVAGPIANKMFECGMIP